MGYRIGSGFVGSSDLTLSKENEEVIPSNVALYKFSFLNKSACHVKINGGDPIFLNVNQGFDSSERDAEIFSFVIIEPDIEYQFIGAY